MSSGAAREESASRNAPATIASLLAGAAARLASAGIEQARREARLLLAHALGLSADALLRRATSDEIDPVRFEALVARRARDREPLAFLLGRQPFWTLDLDVSPVTLIPRADTETLLDAALAWPGPVADRILDLGTGTGALLLAALADRPHAFGVGIDRSEAACRLARSNARRLGMADRSAFLCADWGDPLSAEAGFDLILANPPYIESGAIAGLMLEVRAHEPRFALDGGPDGLDAYRLVLPAIRRCLADGGIGIVEFGIGQTDAVAALAKAASLSVAAVRADLAGVPRAMVLMDATITR